MISRGQIDKLTKNVIKALKDSSADQFTVKIDDKGLPILVKDIKDSYYMTDALVCKFKSKKDFLQKILIDKNIKFENYICPSRAIEHSIAIDLNASSLEEFLLKMAIREG